MSSSLFSLLLQSGANEGSDTNSLLIFIIAVVILVIALILQAKFSTKEVEEEFAHGAHHHAEEDHEGHEEHAAPEAESEPEGEAEPEAEAQAEPEAESAPEEAAASPETESAAPPVETESAPAPAEPPKPDDLKKIEGIGPKVTSLLNENGIYTFAQLADAPVDKLQQILDDAKLQMMNPGSWPKQAKLAAEGKWEELQALQDTLKGGR